MFWSDRNKKKPLKFVRSVTRIFIIMEREGRRLVAYQNILKHHVYGPSPYHKKNIYVRPVAHNIIIMSTVYTHSFACYNNCYYCCCDILHDDDVLLHYCCDVYLTKYTEMCLTNISNDVVRNFETNYMGTCRWKFFR